jgi:glutamate-1-semialdehyde 2,1-aminomutase
MKAPTRNHSKSKTLYERACASLASGVSSEFRKYSYPHPLFYKEGKGAHIIDVTRLSPTSS